MKRIVTVELDDSGDAKSKIKQLGMAVAEAVSKMRPEIIFVLAVHTVMLGLLEEMGIIEGDKDTSGLLKKLGVRFASDDNLAEVLKEVKAEHAEKEAEKPTEKADEDGEEVTAYSCQPIFSAEGETTNPQH